MYEELNRFFFVKKIFVAETWQKLKPIKDKLNPFSRVNLKGNQIGKIVLFEVRVSPLSFTPLHKSVYYQYCSLYIS